MLKKLLKYEWKTASKMLLLMHGIVLLMALFDRITLQLSGGMGESGSYILDTVNALLMFAMVMVIGSVCLFTYVYLAYRFYKNVFTDQGYLTNTLPVTPTQIILSKGICSVVWMVIDALVLILAICILAGHKEFFADLGDILGELMKIFARPDPTCWITLIILILAPFVTTIQLYFCVAVGNLCKIHKVLGSIGVYIATYIIQQITGLIILVATNFDPVTSTVTTESGLHVALSDMMFSPMLLSLIFSVVCAVLFWFATRSIMTKRLNLQ